LEIRDRRLIAGITTLKGNMSVQDARRKIGYFLEEIYTKNRFRLRFLLEILNLNLNLNLILEGSLDAGISNPLGV
jgi:hypothetical protein